MTGLLALLGSPLAVQIFLTLGGTVIGAAIKHLLTDPTGGLGQPLHSVALELKAQRDKHQATSEYAACLQYAPVPPAPAYPLASPTSAPAPVVPLGK